MFDGASRIALGVLLGLAPSCAIDDSPGDPSEELIDGDGAAADDAPSDAVCTTGKYRCLAHVQRARARAGQITPHAAPPGFGPPDLQSAYKIDPSITVGTKPTVAIVIAFGYSALEADLAMYRTQFGLPACTVANGCLKIVNQNGQTTPMPPDPPLSDDWTLEGALDVDMVSAACPKCGIIAVLTNDNAEGLFIGQAAAMRLNATVISNSWGGPEGVDDPPEVMQATEAYLTQPGVAIFAAAGDDGYNDANAGPDYPGTSARVISVGGTRLTRDPTAGRGWSETAWVKGGSACSLSVPKPAYQTTSPCGFKATSDIAAVGDPGTGVAVFNARAGGWGVVGGTSASSPFVAGIFAATGNGGQTSGAFLATRTDKLYDVTLGTNGTCGTSTILCNAGAGWDGPTGYGTPNAAALLPAGSTPDKPKVDTDVSGGCSAGGGGAGALIGFALLGLRRRQRARAAAATN